MRLSKLRKLNLSAIGWCAMVFVPPLAIGKKRNGGSLLRKKERKKDYLFSQQQHI
jgi:hypothetical protein